MSRPLFLIGGIVELMNRVSIMISVTWAMRIRRRCVHDVPLPRSQAPSLGTGQKFPITDACISIPTMLLSSPSLTMMPRNHTCFDLPSPLWLVEETIEVIYMDHEALGGADRDTLTHS